MISLRHGELWETRRPCVSRPVFSCWCWRRHRRLRTTADRRAAPTRARGSVGPRRRCSPGQAAAILQDSILAPRMAGRPTIPCSLRRVGTPPLQTRHGSRAIRRPAGVPGRRISHQHQVFTSRRETTEVFHSRPPRLGPPTHLLQTTSTCRLHRTILPRPPGQPGPRPHQHRIPAWHAETQRLAREATQRDASVSKGAASVTAG